MNKIKDLRQVVTEIVTTCQPLRFAQWLRAQATMVEITTVQAMGEITMT